MKYSKLRPGARALIAATVVAGAAAVALRIPDAIGWTRNQMLAAASLAAAMAIVEQFSITLRFKSENLFFSLTDAVWAAGLMLTSGSVLSIALAVGVLSGQLVKRVHPMKAAFNVGVYLVGITGAEAIYSAFGHPSAQQPRAWLAAGLGMAQLFVLNALLISLVIALVERKPFASILVPPLLADFLHRLGNLALGIVVAVQKVAGNWRVIENSYYFDQ